MKFVRFSLLWMLCVALFACSKDENPTDNGNGNNDTPAAGSSAMSFTVNGPGIDNLTIKQPYTFYTNNYTYWEDEDNSVGTLIGTNTNMTIVFKGHEKGTYTIGDDNFIAMSVIFEDNITRLSLASESGTITISEANPQTGQLKGTFSGVFLSTEDRSYNVSNGSFYIRPK